MVKYYFSFAYLFYDQEGLNIIFPLVFIWRVGEGIWRGFSFGGQEVRDFR
jgi:hypothetical protein